MQPCSAACSADTAMPSAPSESRSASTEPSTNISLTVVASKANNGSVAEPSMIAGLIRLWLTTSTPGVERSSSARSRMSPDIVSDPPACTMWVPVNSVSSEPAIDVFAEAANTVMKPTSATPIIIDAAVRAVRFGFRVALRVASSPLSPRSRSGSPNNLATGRASTGARTTTPANVASTALGDGDGNDGDGPQAVQVGDATPPSETCAMAINALLLLAAGASFAGVDRHRAHPCRRAGTRTSTHQRRCLALGRGVG